MVRRIILFLAFLAIVQGPAVAQIKVSQLPAASSVSDSDLTMVVQGGANKQAAASLLRQILASNITDSTTVGRAIVKVANPSAIRFLRINADNSVTLLDASSFLTAIGGGASTWGAIGGTLSNQTDLQAALDAKQPLDSDLTAIAALTTTSFGRGLLDDADATAGRSSLGVIIGTNVQAFDADLTTYASITPSANVQTFLGAADYAAMRTQLGLVIGTNVLAPNGNGSALTGLTFTQLGGSATDAQVPDNITITGLSGTNSGDVTLAGTPTYITISGQVITRGLVNLATDTSAIADFSGKTDFLVPSGTAPTTNAAAEIAFDTNAWAASRGAIQSFDGTSNAYAVATQASDTPTNGQVPKWNTGGTITWEDDSTAAGGTGDFSSNTSTSVDGEVVLFSGTLGKTGRRATGTGVVRLASGVQSAAELSGDVTTSGSNAVTVSRINGTSLGGLASGLLKNTTSTGVPSIAVAGTDYLAPSGIGSTVQAWDADLDALSALTGTNNIYYRSASNTWTSVSIGSGLSFSAGTLSATGGGSGDVTAASSFGTDNVVIRSDGTGKGVQSTGISIDDSNNISGIAATSTTTIEMGGVTDTTLSRLGAGTVGIEGVTVATGTNTISLSGKTLTAPKFADLGFIADANGNELFILDTVTSAVNEVTFANAATGANPKFSGTGGDTDVGIDFAVKAAGKFNLLATASGPAELRFFEDSDNGTMYAGLAAPATITPSSYTVTLPNAASTLPIFGQQITFSGPTAARTVTFPDANFTAARTDAANTFTGVQSMTSPDVTTSITTPSTTFALFNATATTINAFGAATTVNTGASATQIWNFGGSTTASEFRFLEPSGSGTNYTAFKAKAQGANITYTLPDTVASAGQFLKDVAGDGVLSWATPSGSGDVTAASSFGTDNVVIRSDGTGKGVQSTGVSIDDSNNITGVATLTATTASAGTLEFEGATADAFETSIAVVDPTADRTTTLPNADTKLPIYSQHITYSGPTAARTVTYPDASFTVARTDAANTFTGVQTMTSAALTTPAITGAATWQDGVRQTFNPDGTNAGLNVGSQAGDPSSPSNGDLWYDSTNNTLDARINGATVNLGAGGGTDSNAIHGNASGEINAITDKTTPVAADHLLIEDSAASNAKKDITVGSQETALEGVMDLQDMQGAVTDGQIPSAITRDSEAAAAYQPLDSDLTSIAALTTTSFGRGLLDDADAAAGRTSFELSTPSGWANTDKLVTTSAPSSGVVTVRLDAGSTGINVFTAPAGSSSDISMSFTPKGTAGVVQFTNSSTTTGFGITGTTYAGGGPIPAGEGITFFLSSNYYTATAAGFSLLDDADAAAQRTTLGLVIGTNVQAFDADLTTYAGITPSANVQSLLGAADYAAMRTQLGLVIGTNVQAFDADLDALAALSGTNNIYYRSAANTWTAVTIGSGLTFSGGSLSASAGGAPSDATYITQTSNGTLSAEQAIGSLSSGFMSSTTTTGVVATRTLTEGLAIDITNTTGGGDPSFAFDPTELTGSRTFGDASTNTIVWTIDRQTGTDPTITFNSGSIGLPALTLTTALAAADGGTGLTSLGTGVATWLGTPSSANLRSALTDEVGTGSAMFTRTGVRRTVYINAGAMIARTTNGAATATVNLATNNIMFDSFDFDSTTSEGVGFWFTPPTAYDAGTITAKFHWTAASGSGTATWSISARALGDGDAIDQALGTAQAVTDTLLSANQMHITSTTSAMTIAGTPAANKPVYWQITRDVADTLNADARLIGVTIEYTESATEPSAQ